MVSEVLLGMPWENNHYVEYGANAWLLFTLVSQILLIYKAAHGHHFSSALFSKSALYVCKYSQILLLHSAFHPRIIQPPKLLLFLNLRILKFTVYTVQFCECQQMYSSTYPPPLKYHTQPFHCSPQSLVFHLISTPPRPCRPLLNSWQSLICSLSLQFSHLKMPYPSVIGMISALTGELEARGMPYTVLGSLTAPIKQMFLYPLYI